MLRPVPGFLLALAGAALVMLTSGCAAFFDVVGRPTVEDVRTRITKIGFLGVTLTFDIDIRNPYVVPLRSPRFRYALDVEDAPLIEPREHEGVDVAARSVGTVTVPVRLSYTNVWCAYKKLRQAREFAYRLHGAFIISAGDRSFELPVSHRGTLPVLRPPKFSNVRATFSNVSLTSAAVTVEADAENPNIFDLDVKDVGYVLTLGETRVGDLSAGTLGKIAPGMSGKVILQGRISAVEALVRLLRGEPLGKAKLSPTGVIRTPYGTAELDK